jgi:VanZ family protein
MFFKRTRLWAAHLRWRSNPVVVLLFLWGVFIVYGTLLPFQFSASSEDVAARLRRIWEDPRPSGARADALSNFLLFLPWGFWLAVWRAQSGTSYVASVILAALSGAFLSVCVETAQLFTPSRTTSLLDLATNTAGSLVGALIGWPFSRWAWTRLIRRGRELVVTRPLSACALAAAAGLLIAGLAPFDVSVQLDQLKNALRNARLIPFGPPLSGIAAPIDPWSWATELLTWTISGGLFALAAREAGRHRLRAMLPAVLGSGALALTIELLQLVVSGHVVDMTSVVIALLGAALGAFVVARAPSGDARRWVMPALFVWGGLAVLTYWTPPEFAWPEPPFFRLEWFVPFWAYYVRTSGDALADIVGQVMFFIPSGALLAAKSPKRSIIQAALFGLAIGAAMEAGQVFLPARTAELTDALSAAVGAAMGLGLWRWGESVRDPAHSFGNVRYRVARFEN